MFDPRFPLEGLQSSKEPSAKIRDRRISWACNSLILIVVAARHVKLQTRSAGSLSATQPRAINCTINLRRWSMRNPDLTRRIRDGGDGPTF